MVKCNLPGGWKIYSISVELKETNELSHPSYLPNELQLVAAQATACAL